MASKRNKPLALAEFAESLQRKGYNSFTKKAAVEALKISENAFRIAVARLARQNKIIRVRNSLYVVIPPELRGGGAPPPIDYIDDLMNFLKLPYYIGLLSAAAQFGATHQAVQVLQVVTTRPLRKLQIGRGKIQFIFKKQIESTPTLVKNTRTGTVRFSTPEATALDLLKYPAPSGHLNHIATVLSELSENIDGEKLMRLAKQEGDLHAAQRLGYLLDTFSKGKTTKPLHSWISRQNIKPIGLSPLKYPAKSIPLNGRWQIFVNEDVEPDDL